ncbi:BTA121 domain-containing protein surface lipoprotein, partial [Borrelia hispanica]|uniref:BTA121 domain-containing protein surface lipoprotein n=1 Tax=Borrelia hispanica TaxID=40835 RepID=UPI0005715AC3
MYNGPDKDVLIKRLKDKETEYVRRLKTACYAFKSDDLYKNLLGTLQYGLEFKSIIVEDIKSYHDIYDQVLEKLNNDKMRAALTFLETAISIPDLTNPGDLGIINKTRQTFCDFCKFFLDTDSIVRLERALSGIVETLSKKEGVERILAEYGGPNKNILTQRLKDIETEYSKYLKNICSHDSIYDMENSLLSNANNASSFIGIETEVTSCNSKYINIISKFSEEGERALIFFKDSVIDPNLEPLDSPAMTLRIIQNFSYFLFDTDNGSFDNIKKAILSVVMTLRTRKFAEEVIEKYVTGSEKNMIERIFQVEEVRYKKYLKSIFNCDMSSYDNTICFDVMQMKYDPYLWESIVNGTYRYYDIFSKISEQLSNEERDALAFLEDVITNLVPGNPDGHEVTIKTRKYRSFIVDIDDVDKLRSALLNIVLTLNAKKMAEKALVDYTGAGKSILLAKLEDTKAEYVRNLRSICDTCSMYDHLSSTQNYVLQFEGIVNDVNSYSSIMKKLGDEERDALIFVEDSIMIYNPNDPSDYKSTMDLSANYSDFILEEFYIDVFKRVLSKVVKTLKSQKRIEDALKNYVEPGKDILEQRFREVKAEYMKHLKSICNVSTFENVKRNLLKKSDYSSQFEDIAISIDLYKSVFERLDANAKKALDFLEKCITRANPDDSDDHEIIIQAKRNYNLLILESNDISKLKLVLSGIVATLNEKKIVEDVFKEYTKIGKDVLKQKFRDIKVDYMTHLKNICNVSTVDEMESNLLSNSNYTPQFSSIAISIASYKSVLEGLNVDDGKALDFLEKSITRSNSDGLNEHEITIQMKRNYNSLMLDANNDISKFKPVLLGIVETLKAKKKAKNALREYTKPGKDILEQRLQDIKTEYKRHLKNICNVSTVDEMKSNLLSNSNYTSQFSSIAISIASYKSVLEGLDVDDGKALDFLEKSITRSNPDDSHEHEITIQMKRNYNSLMLDANNDISKFKLVLLGVVETLKSKKKAKDALKKYTGVGKDVLEQRFQEVRAEYKKHLKNVCNTFYLYEMENNLLRNANSSFQFENIVKSIALYSGVLERLGDNDKKALGYLEKCITRANPDDSNDHEITTQMTRNYDLLMLDANNDISKFKLVLLGIVETLKAKKKAKNALREYTNPRKDILEQRFKDAEAEYMRYLKGICNTLYFNEMYNNLLRKTDNSSQFKSILESIHFYGFSYHNFVIIMGQLDKDEQNALIFLEYAIINPSFDDPNDHEIIISAKRNYSFLTLYEDDISKLKLVLSGIVRTLKEKKLAEDALQKYTRIEKDVLEQRFQVIKTKYMKHLKNICNISSIDEMKSNLLNNADHSLQFRNIVESINYHISIEERLNIDEKNALAFLESVITIFNQSNLEFVTHTKYNFYIFILQIGNIDRLKAILLGIVKMLNATIEIEKVLENYSGANKEQFIQRLQKENTNYIKLLKRVCNTYSFVKMYSDLLNRADDVLQFISIDIDLKYYTKLIMKYNHVSALQIFTDRARMAVTELLYKFSLSDEHKETAMYLRKALVDTAKTYTNDTFYDLLSKLNVDRVKAIMNNMLEGHHLSLFYRASGIIKNIQVPDVKRRLQDRLDMA